MRTDGKGAPTFKATKGLATGNADTLEYILDSKYDIHYVEYSVRVGGSTVNNEVGINELDNHADEEDAHDLFTMSANTGYKVLKGRLYDREAYKGFIE